MIMIDGDGKNVNIPNIQSDLYLKYSVLALKAKIFGLNKLSKELKNKKKISKKENKNIISYNLNFLRQELRNHYLALAFLRSKKYSTIENKRHPECLPDLNKIVNILFNISWWSITSNVKSVTDKQYIEKQYKKQFDVLLKNVAIWLEFKQGKDYVID